MTAIVIIIPLSKYTFSSGAVDSINVTFANADYSDKDSDEDVSDGDEETIEETNL